MSLLLIQLGRIGEAIDVKKNADRLMDASLKDSLGMLFEHDWKQLYLAYDESDIDNDTELRIEFLREWRMNTFFLPFVVANTAYIRLAQMEKATGYEEQRRARLKLKTAIQNLAVTAKTDSQIAHLLNLRAGLERLKGNFKKALALVEKSHLLAIRTENALVLFRISIERAKCFRAMCDQLRFDAEIASCVTQAVQYGWSARMKGIEKEFGEIEKNPIFSAVSSSRTPLAGVPKNIVGTIHGGDTIHGAKVDYTSHVGMTRVANGKTMVKQVVTKEERALAAIIQVALASTDSFDPVDQAGSVLNEIVKLFGAERAYLFMIEEEESEVLIPAPKLDNAPTEINKNLT
jgi:hypothetical protein